jgi:hypothetical protein
LHFMRVTGVEKIIQPLSRIPQSSCGSPAPAQVPQ